MLEGSREPFVTARYAIYYAPDPGSAWWRFGSHWLGRCAATERRLPQPTIGGVDPAVLKDLTAAPRRYGFHATVKPPFQLARGANLPELVQAVDRFCARQCALRLPRLVVAELDGFLALTLPAKDARIESLAAACMRGLDRFRAAPGTAELARRRQGALSAREDALLARWGYPYVLDRYRFHLSLTGTLREATPPVVAALRAAAADAAAALEAEPLHLDGLCIFEEPSPGGDLRVVHRARFGRQGRLIYVIGPSGAGKDSLLEWVRARLPSASGVRLARRTITRPSGAGGEDHVAATHPQFDAALARGDFSMHWRANDHRYGIGREVEAWLAAGDTVVVNGSREYLPIARARFPQLEAVQVIAPDATLRSRLVQRGRELPGEAARRLARNRRFQETERTADLLLVNDGPIEVAGARLADFISGKRGAT
jgi:ribose 1,5-bisphosphokinase